MTLDEQMAAKRAEFDELSRKIAELPAGAVRFELKKRRNGLTGEMSLLFQRQVSEQLASDNPHDVVSPQFGTPRPERTRISGVEFEDD